MKDLAEIKRINAEEGVGEKLGQWSGNPTMCKAIAAKAFWGVRQDMRASKGPSEPSDPIDGWDAEPGQEMPQGHSPLLEKVIL